MIIYATNIHAGGGKILLDEVLQSQMFGPVTAVFIDDRYQLPSTFDLSNISVFRAKPRLLSRWNAELQLKNYGAEHPGEQVLCFGNLPPLFRLKNRVTLFLQNAFLLSAIPIPKDKIQVFLRYTYERTWLRLFSKNIDQVWVQTKWMLKNLPPNLKSKAKLQVILPTLPVPEPMLKKYLFISVTGFEKHKNLSVLLQALKKIDLQNHRVAIVTSTPIPKADPNNIDFFSHVSRSELFKLYQQSKCLIMTSEIESFCLPLHEAKHFGLDIIATDLEFTHEAVSTPYLISGMNMNNLKKTILNYLEQTKPSR